MLGETLPAMGFDPPPACEKDKGLAKGKGTARRTGKRGKAKGRPL